MNDKEMCDEYRKLYIKERKENIENKIRFSRWNIIHRFLIAFAGGLGALMTYFINAFDPFVYLVMLTAMFIVFGLFAVSQHTDVKNNARSDMKDIELIDRDD